MQVLSANINFWILAKNRMSQVVFCGDSPNDEPMFKRFPFAAGVANISHYKKLIKHFPAFIASKECGDGFAEIAEVILEKRREAK